MYLLLANPVADWISKTFPIIQTILIILITLFAIVVIVAVLAQPSNPSGGKNVIMGTNNESYYSNNKSKNKEGRLKRLIVFSAVAILLLTIIYFISFGIYNG